MAVKTKAQIKAEIATLFADNSSNAITEAYLRTVCNDIVDSYFDAPYLKLVPNIQQSGTSAPIFVDSAGANNPLENTLGEVPTWSRTSAGIYKMTTVAALFTQNALHFPYCVAVGSTSSIVMPLIDGGGLAGYIYLNRETDYIIRLTCVDETLTPTELSTLITSGTLCLPEIRSYIS